MSIVRVGLAETRKFAEGYEAIFGKKKEGEKKTDESEKVEKVEKARKTEKKAAKKPARKK